MPLSKKAVIQLLDIARQAIGCSLRGEALPEFPPHDDSLQQKAGCFVTIKIADRLRGCIGNFISQQPLAEEVATMAIAAATHDPRFMPMSERELERCTLDISVLSPLTRIADIAEISVGIHGLYLVNGTSRGVLLPQVAIEQGWDKETFLEQTCIKAGLPAQHWQLDTTELYIFSAEILSEKDLMDTMHD